MLRSIVYSIIISIQFESYSKQGKNIWIFQLNAFDVVLVEPVENFITKTKKSTLVTGVSDDIQG